MTLGHSIGRRLVALARVSCSLDDLLVDLVDELLAGRRPWTGHRLQFVPRNRPYVTSEHSQHLLFCEPVARLGWQVDAGPRQYLVHVFQIVVVKNGTQFGLRSRHRG